MQEVFGTQVRSYKAHSAMLAFTRR